MSGYCYLFLVLNYIGIVVLNMHMHGLCIYKNTTYMLVINMINSNLTLQKKIGKTWQEFRTDVFRIF